MITTFVHVFFKVCLDNICPRIGSWSNLTAQDVCVVTMLVSEKKFDLSGLLIQNMLDVFEGNQTTGIPYRCLLSRIFLLVWGGTF